MTKDEAMKVERVMLRLPRACVAYLDTLAARQAKEDGQVRVSRNTAVTKLLVRMMRDEGKK